ncbi:hypothetical protein P691DRAFT_715188 [Macrolepiota fuliginosa MF-IS2]|uniref:F-box domain-containing protein n=1 Tax=Macrolepiota fuliginosa MF-IS2 TaxID=1400762 RepID=A0A9P5WYE3_9AGAR|nr:hypothetical protein P691DRAFT_715188 [Macrolepiota fuliginosa MF-IS2]
MTLLDLPPEILTRVLLYVPFTSLMTCKAVSHHLQVLITESVELQYYIHLSRSGLVDNPRCDLPISERLSWLLARERRWEEFDFDFDKIVEVPSRLQHNYTSLSGGYFSAITEDEESHYIRLPTAHFREIKWQAVRPEKKIISDGVWIYEQDLHILITAQKRTVHANATGPRAIYEIQVHLNQLSTGEPHPNARRATISFDVRAEFEKPWITSECTGDNLVLVLCDLSGRIKPDDEMYIYDWKTGELKLRHGAPFRSYNCPIILTTHIFLLPNERSGELECWRIPQSPPELTHHQPFFVLSLPRLHSGNTFQSIDPRVEPNLGNRLSDASKPFYTNPHHAIVIFMVLIRSSRISLYPGFTFFIHRSSLVEYVDKFSAFASFNHRPEPVPYDEWGPPVCRWLNVDDTSWIATTFGQRYVAPPLEAGIDGAPLTILDFNPVAVSEALAVEKQCLKARGPDDDGRNTAQNEGNECTKGGSLKNNGETGPGCKAKDQEMFLQVHEDNAQEIPPGPLMEKMKVCDSSCEPELRGKVITRAVTRAMDPLSDPNHCFENTVYSSLPYTVRSSQVKYSFDALLLDEESILGIRMTDSERIKEIHVLHCG